MYLIKVKGVVQGVGFRPFVYREAMKHKIKGYVKNIGSGVEILSDKKEFADIFSNPPPLAQIDSVEVKKLQGKEKESAIKRYEKFEIKKSGDDKGETILPPDIFTCENCIKELRDKKDRRYEYYFITCTDCGPRFSMIENYPYDRPTTAMQDFEMCEKCKKEYSNPLDRRYHAQTIACHDCGPRLRLLKEKEDISAKTEKETIEKAAKLIKEGKIIAIKGVGGFHIVSRADENTIKEVRKILRRPHKPFALMVRDEDMLKSIAKCNEKELKILKSPQRPIVVLKKKDITDFKEVSELDSIGVMFPYTALHFLLFDFLDEPLVMTSANIPGEPVSISESIAPYFLTHNRRIVNRCDDSVIKVINNHPVFLRRSRGYAPVPIKMKKEGEDKDTIALGAEMNNVICISKKDNAFLSQYIGETSKLKTFEFLKDATDTLIRLTRCKPEIIVCDKHPGYNTTLYAKKLAKKYDAKLIKIQHHHAHIASVACEYNLKDYIGIACDGMGYGEDGEIWGGEVFDVTNNKNFERIGHLELQPMLGGDSATLNPKKMLFGILSKIMTEKELIEMNLFDEKESKLYLRQLKENFNIHQTTSTGRVLDATSALLGLCDKTTYEGRPALVLESHADAEPLNLEPVIEKINGKNVLMTSPLFKFIINDTKHTIEEKAATVHNYIAKGLLKIAKSVGNRKKIVFSGGVVCNKHITTTMTKSGVIINKAVPPGDGCISLGQCFLTSQKHIL